MNIRQKKKLKLKHVMRESRHLVHGNKMPRKREVYYQDYCCRSCFFDWGRFFEKRHLYNHNCAQSNYDGLLKKYWINTDEKYDWSEL